MGYVVMACLASTGIGVWIGWSARSMKATLEAREIRSLERHRRSMRAMESSRSRYLQ